MTTRLICVLAISLLLVACGQETAAPAAQSDAPPTPVRTDAATPSTEPQTEDVGTESVVHRTATCGCCHLWQEAMEEEGLVMETRIVEQNELNAIREAAGIPTGAAGCHTAEIAGYVIEGHVPAFAIQRLLAQRPEGAAGLVVPGMPPSSPGMGGPLVEYDIYLLTDDGQLEPFARARGSEEIQTTDS